MTAPDPYRATLRMPRTAFPMRADLARREPESLDRWDALDLYASLAAGRPEAPPFTLHDGPPFANGPLHAGHLLNKVLKDLAVRHAAMTGRRVSMIPGWDCHGLPIEHLVLAQSPALAAGDASHPAQRRTRIRAACARHARDHAAIQARQARRLLVLADFARPYRTMDPAYESAAIGVLADLLAHGLVHRAARPVPWSPTLRTALAEAELEHQELTARAFVVAFAASNPSAVAARFGVALASGERPAFAAWTTAPWTLAAHLAIGVAPALAYTLVRIGGRVLVVAAGSAWAARGEPLGQARGADLVGLGYTNPTDGAERRTIAAHFATVEGTGLVHLAPAHGPDDFRAWTDAGGAPPVSIVGPDGRFGDAAPEWLRDADGQGATLEDGTERIARRVIAADALVADERTVHRGLVDWRSHAPIVHRLSAQWFCTLDRPYANGPSLRDRALAAIAQPALVFDPPASRARLAAMVGQRPDWCLSRQRAWGLPIPAFAQPSGTPFLTAASARAIARRFAERGSNAWYELAPAALLDGYDPAADPDAPAALDIASLVPLDETLDVWFESGSSWRAVLEEPGGPGVPGDLVVEGTDQHRGWFQSSLLLAVAVRGAAPYRRVATHGFLTDGAGAKLSKSSGTAVSSDELVARAGAEPCRWWVASIDSTGEISLDGDRLDLAVDAYRRIRNALRYLLGNLDGLDPATEAVPPTAHVPTSLEAWILAELDGTTRAVVAARDALANHRATAALFAFVNDALSPIFCEALKDRLYCDSPASPRRRAARSALHVVARTLCRLLAPILPHTADEAWRSLPGAGDGACVHLERYPEPTGAAPDSAWPLVLTARSAALAALERARESGGPTKPLDAGVVLPDPDGTLARFELADLADLVGCSRVALDPAARAAVVWDLRDQPRCERSMRRDATVRQRSDGGWLSDRDAAAVGLA